MLKKGITMIKRASILFIVVAMAAFIYGGRAHAEEAEQRFTVVIYETLTDESVMAAWLAYAFTRGNWYEKAFFEAFPSEKEYRYTFEEEVDARRTLCQVWSELLETDATLKDKYLDEVSMVFKSGYLGEYVAYYIGFPEEAGLRTDEFAKWAAENISAHKFETRSGIDIPQEQDGEI
ncbi:MAG: hypothetical protein AUJ75_03030 [Candidatus Omnitrophica bacterium CG1_02_49_10]|nr:MAG: hypothetical protein AUJ75_03030 [Candidatus Omnitrophica bacterium CG1_02_49_10]